MSGGIDLVARLWTCADGLRRRHNKGRPGSARLMHRSAEVVTQTTWENPEGFFADDPICALTALRNSSEGEAPFLAPPLDLTAAGSTRVRAVSGLSLQLRGPPRRAPLVRPNPAPPIGGSC